MLITQRKFKLQSSPVANYRESAFTLIEVMVGVAIFAVLSALIVGSLQSNADRNAKLEAQRFIAVVNEVRDEAVISGKTFVLQMNEKGKNYEFTLFGSDEQAQGADDRLLRPRDLHESVKLKWEVYDDFDEDDPFAPQADAEQDSAEDTDPRVFVTALGELTPFKARFVGEDNDFIVELNDDGVLDMDIKPSNFF